MNREKVLRGSFLLICLFSLVSQMTYAQPTYKFSYDEAGNRVKREVIDLSEVPEDPNEPELKTFPSKNTSIADKSQIEEEKFQVRLEEVSIAVFPNPVQDILKIQISELKQGEVAKVYLYNQSGAVIKQLEVREKVESTLELNALAPGSYVLLVELNDSKYDWLVIKD
jgi:hypothetical protein